MTTTSTSTCHASSHASSTSHATSTTKTKNRKLERKLAIGVNSVKKKVKKTLSKSLSTEITQNSANLKDFSAPRVPTSVLTEEEIQKLRFLRDEARSFDQENFKNQLSMQHSDPGLVGVQRKAIHSKNSSKNPKLSHKNPKTPLQTSLSHGCQHHYDYSSRNTSRLKNKETKKLYHSQENLFDTYTTSQDISDTNIDTIPKLSNFRQFYPNNFHSKRSLDTCTQKVFTKTSKSYEKSTQVQNSNHSNLSSHLHPNVTNGCQLNEHSQMCQIKNPCMPFSNKYKLDNTYMGSKKNSSSTSKGTYRNTFENYEKSIYPGKFF